MKWPQMNTKQATGLLGEIAAKVKRFDGSEDEDTEGDGVTTGPSHPSLESDVPKTPSDEGIPKVEPKSSMGPPPPPPPPLPSPSRAMEEGAGK